VRHIFQYFFSNRNFVEEFKKGMEFLFFYFNEGDIRYFLLRSSQKMQRMMSFILNITILKKK